MGLINGNNDAIFINESLSSVLPDYYDNLKTAIDERFKTANSNFALTNCVVTSNGLSMTSFGSAIYEKCTQMVYTQLQTRFVYSGNVVFGLYAGGCFGCVNTSEKTLTVYKEYNGSSTMPSTVLGSASITDDFVVGDEYTITMDCKSVKSMVTTFRNIKTGNEVKVATSFGASRGVKDFGVCLFSGTIKVTQLLCRLPLYNHAKCLFVGDSTTWGGVVTDYEQNAWAFTVMSDYFHNDGLISARGGDNITGGIAVVKDLYSQGWSFNYIIMALGTNVDWDLSANWSYSEQVAKRRETLVNFDEYCANHGAILLWAAPPANPNDDLTESLEDAEADTTTKGFPSRTILRKLIIDVFDDRCIRFDLATMTNGAYDSQYFADGLHPNDLGNSRQASFGIERLTTLDYH